MIVCHCQNISDEQIRSAVDWMRASDPATIITPGKVYHALGKRAECGGCMPLLLAAKSRAESIEEMHHADKFIARIIFLEGHPNLQKMGSLRIRQTVKETLNPDLAAEHGARTLYIDARQYCDQVGDFVSRAKFDEILADEEGHIDFLETQLDLYETLGGPGYALLNASPANA